MLLRRSGEIQEENYDLTGVTGQGTIGVENEETLNAIADAVFYADAGDLEKIRARKLFRRTPQAPRSRENHRPPAQRRTPPTVG